MTKKNDEVISFTHENMWNTLGDFWTSPRTWDLNSFNLVMIAMSSPMATTLESVQGADTLDYICKYYGVF